MENVTHPVAQTVDVDATLAMLDLVFGGIAAGKLAYADGKLDFSDMQYLPAVVLAAGPAFQKVKELPGELGSLNAEEAHKVLEYAASRLPGLVGDELARKVNAALKVGISIAECYAAFANVQVALK